jgi:Stigma-specific protein, Stig1
MRTTAVLLLCSITALAACGTGPVIDRNDASGAEASLDAAGADGFAVDVVLADGSDVATTVDAADASDRDAADASAGDADPCPMGQSLCGATCVDLQTSASNCGMCGRMCPGGAACAMGVCQATCGLAGLPCCVGSNCEEGTTCTAGMCVRGMPAPTYSGSSLVSSGTRANSTNFRMLSTLGQSSQHQRQMTSTNFVLNGGLVGVVGGL